MVREDTAIRYYLICDGGGTKCEFVLFDQTGNIVSTHNGGGGNALFIDVQKVLDSVEEGIFACLRKGGIILRDLTVIVLFIPGFSTCIEMLRERLNYSHITLLSDEENALYGALGTKPGIVVLSGTGSFAVGRSGQGEKVVCGGWGPLIGDLGSGYHIGIMALSTIARRFDQGKDGGLLSNAVLDRLGLQEVRLLKRALYQPGLSRAQIASLSFTVEEVARKGNADALAIIDTAARDLAELASDVALRMAEESPCVALVGGISRMKDIIVRPFWNYIQEMIPHATRIDGEFPPSVGAMLYVLDTYEHIDICEMEKLLQEKGRLRTTC